MKSLLWQHRLARSLTTILVATLIQTLSAPILAPRVFNSAAEAVTGTITPASNPGGTTIKVPYGVTSVTIDAWGGAGGKGGNFGSNLGGSSSNVNHTWGTFEVSGGDVIGLYPGESGTAGVNNAPPLSAGGAGAADTFPNGYYIFNGFWPRTYNFAGGSGGTTPGGTSYGGSGGGAGSASVMVRNNEIVMIAGGGGGGGGASDTQNYAVPFGQSYTPNSSNFNGANGASPSGCGTNGTVGGSGGGGGGGYWGGIGGTSTQTYDKCSGKAGSPGGPYAIYGTTDTGYEWASYSGRGTISYTFNYSNQSTCSPTSSVVDIYTVLTFTQISNCDWAVPTGVSTIDVFAVGGGGGGGAAGGSGGGGGAAISRTAVQVSANSNLKVRVGAGGLAPIFGGLAADAGDSSTITLASGLSLSALGGSPGNSDTATSGVFAGAGGVAGNGGFAGGAGGLGATKTNLSQGLVGKSGISNYFFGVKNEYGGGGGGGLFNEACASSVVGAAGASGGGAGGSCTSSQVQDGSPGTANTGGGGGGGGTSSEYKRAGGRGGSGVIIIRYATDAANSFPASVASSLSARWSPDGLQLLDSTRKGWIDSSGSKATLANSAIAGTTTSITTRGSTDGANLTDSNKTNLVVKGGTSDIITLTDLPTNYTLFSVARYVTGGSKGRVITTSTGNWLSSLYNGVNGCAHHNTWLTGGGCNTTNVHGWQIGTDQLKYFRQNGVDISLNQDANNGGGHYYLYNQSTSSGFGINNYWNGEKSDWELADMLIFNRELTAGEIRAVETYISRVYGITLAGAAISSETDTAASFNVSYFRGQYLSGMYINDTFTVEAWVNPATVCNTGNCALFNYESVLVTKIQSGEFQYALWGVNSTWTWINTGVKIPAGEWHHIALTKRLRYGQANAVDLYVDGQLAWTRTGNPYTDAAPNSTTTDVVNTNDTWWYLGYRSDGNYFYGSVDEFKLWKVARTGAEIAADMHSNDASSPNMQLYFDFNRNSLTNSMNLQNFAMGGAPRSDMIAQTSINYVDVKSVVSSGPYTTITFPRTYITQNGGWKVPDSVTAASVVVVGGGGGGAGQYTTSINESGGGGGGGGVFEIGSYPLSGSTYLPVSIGTGGLGGPPSGTQANAYGRRGGTTSFNTTLTAGGGGGGMFTTFDQMNGAPGTAGGGGGGSTGYWNAYDQGIGGTGNSITIGSTTYAGRTGGNGRIWTGSDSGSGGGAGGSASATAPGAGITSSLSGTTTEYGRGGTARSVTSPAWVATPIAPGNGGDGYRSTNLNGGNGVKGANGVVILRYITALKPTYTKPTTARLNVGMTETFTTNVATDSATVGLTRTFRWESTTAGAGGTFTTIKQGTGASNAAFTWVPSDTSTTGSNYLYRLTVTDSDTAGLFITDSSTAFAVINGTLVMTGVNTIKKQINVARNETFTITSGTPTYRYTLLPAIPGITLDTSTVGSAVLKISDTASVGTYLETLTVIDSVSASVAIPLSITISAPPSLVNYSEIESNDLVFNIDMSNSASYSRSTGTISDVSGTKKPVTIVGGSTFSEDYSGNLKLSTSQYISASGFGTLSAFTIEAYINLQSISSSQVCIFGAEQSPTNVPYFLCIDTTRTVFTGFYNGQWTYKRTSQTLTLGAWTHVVGVFDSTTAGVKVELYINGVATTLSDSAQNAGLIPPSSSTGNVYINKWFWTSTAPSSAMDIGFVRLYRTPLSQAKIVQNYNATKDRFAVSNINQIKPSQKYGAISVESFTVTTGGDTKTVTFAVGNRTGIAWDTATAGLVKLTVQETLMPGTYYDTITVTDNFSQSTSLPIKFTVSKADTITVTAGAATTQVYNKAQASSLPAFVITGLVASDTGTVTRKYTGVDWTKTCAQGGGCEVGDTGPGGGTIFYISPTHIDSATGISAGGKYLEVAPLNWSGLGVESTTAWAKAQTTVAGTLSAIGTGAENTRLINNALTTNAVAAKVAADLVLNGKSDWFLPSTLEVKEIYDALYVPVLGGNFTARNYWSSTQGSNTAQADTYWFGNGGLVSTTDKLSAFTVRPIRAYSPDTITATSVPTNVDSYTVTVDTITMTSGSLSNYQNVVYRSSGLDITQARQDSLTVTSYVGNFGTPFTLTILGGAGSGAVTELFAVGSTATGCAITNHVISTSTAGTCNVEIKKAYSRNYFTETVTAVVYLLQWAPSQPSPIGSGATIGLSGETAIIRDPYAAPIITGITTNPGFVTISGSGFGSALNTSTVVKFWRNKVAPLRGDTINNYVANDTTIYIYLIPAGATAGRIAVVTANGTAVSVDSWNP